MQYNDDKLQATSTSIQLSPWEQLKCQDLAFHPLLLQLLLCCLILAKGWICMKNYSGPLLHQYPFMLSCSKLQGTASCQRSYFSMKTVRRISLQSLDSYFPHWNRSYLLRHFLCHQLYLFAKTAHCLSHPYLPQAQCHR
jgi:hypothetical protein